ncbi:MAG: sarcosine oxidase subunit gamma [Alphaproteobacteria bacterium]|nr:sarcosine oxidase subunit gamma [Alphaproteobacteria bacterium]
MTAASGAHGHGHGHAHGQAPGPGHGAGTAAPAALPVTASLDRASPLAAPRATAAALPPLRRMAERPLSGKLALRGDPADAAFMAGAARALGLALPTAPGTVAASGTGEAQRAALWLGPNEWLALVPLAQEAALASALRAALAGCHASVVETGDERVCLALTGADARSVLAKGCSLDLRPRSFAAGRCAQTVLARVNVLLWRSDAEGDPTFEILVRRSFAAWLHDWLVDAGA